MEAEEGNFNMKKIETIGIIGQGALGVMYGNHLTKRYGKDRVFFIVDEERAKRYREQEITCNGTPCEFAYRTPKEAVQADLILFTVKFLGMEAAMETAAPFVGEETLFLSALNGISSEELLEKRFGASHVLYACVQGMDAGKEGNSAHYKNIGYITLGNRNGEKDERLQAVTDFFDDAGLSYQIPDNILREQWNKLMLNTGVNQVTAVYGGTYSLVQKEGEARTMMIEAMKEVKRVAESCQVTLTDDDIDGWLALLSRLDPDGRTSMCQDIRARRRTEVELFAGTICGLAEEAGISVPVNEYLYEKIRELEEDFSKDRRETV